MASFYASSSVLRLAKTFGVLPEAPVVAVASLKAGGGSPRVSPLHVALGVGVGGGNGSAAGAGSSPAGEAEAAPQPGSALDAWGE